MNWRRIALSAPLRRPAKVMLRTVAILLVVCCASLVLSSQGFAQGARHPFAVGANEGVANTANPMSRFILTLESTFFRSLTGAVRSVKESGAATWGLVALSFVYGVVHAAGPGHGKAVIASYLLANEKTFLRGVAISAAAALLQGSVAVALVGVAAILFQATSKQMTSTASILEITSYAGITILGCLLVFKKGKALLALRPTPALASLEPAFAVVAAPPNMQRGTGLAFCVEDARLGHAHRPGCGHLHAVDPRAIGDAHGWKAATLTVLAAGLRPCSGAILVLVFAWAQGVILAGILSVAAMALGTAITTSMLAATAVFGKKAAAKFVDSSSTRFLIVGRLIEAAAAVAVLGLGLVLLAASLVATI